MSYDVIVVGGGLCGVSCAVRCAWEGKKVLLVERRPALGWESTWAGQNNFSRDNSKVLRRIIELLENVGGLRDNLVDPPILEMVLDRIIDEANVDLLLYSYPVRVISDGKYALGVVLGNKNGEQIKTGRIIVDATEEALLWRQFDDEAHPNDLIPSRYNIFFNNVEMELPLEINGKIRVKPSTWKKEAIVEFDIDRFDLLEARRKLKGVIKQVRTEVPELKDALVTHTANDIFPTRPIVTISKNQRLANLFGAGIWIEDVENSPSGRLKVGEKVAEEVLVTKGIERIPEGVSAGSVLGQAEECDLIVVGGGTGGAVAAIKAGRLGVKTKLIEASPVLGGIGTGGAIHSYYYGVNGGIQDEINNLVNEISPLFTGKWKAVGFHPEAKKVVLQQLLEDANVQILLNTVVSGTLCEDITPPGQIALLGDSQVRRRLKGVISVSPNGISVHSAKVFIDSTGDGDIAVMAGAPYQIGRERDNLMHAYSQPCGNLTAEGNLSFMNFDAGYVDPTDIEDLTRGRRWGIRLFWKEKFSEESRILYIAPIIGLRQSRQIIGDYQLTLSDEILGRTFDDAVSFTWAHYDNHGLDYENDSDEAVLWVWGLGNWSKQIGCEVPYRCLLPKNVEGLLLACRAISLTYDAHMEFRMQKDIQRLGEVAAVAAVLAIKSNTFPRDIDVKELQRILKEQGLLNEEHRPRPAIDVNKPLELPQGSDEKIEGFEDKVWISLYRGKEGALALRSLLTSNDPVVRFKASTALAWYGIEDGVKELINIINKRVEEKVKGNKTVPLWQSAIPFLGIAGDRSAISAILSVLKSKDASLDVLISSVRALERIGDSSVIPDLWELLKRKDIQTDRVLQVSTGMINPAVEDARWQLDLAVAEALLKLGESTDKVKEIIDPYLRDQRSYVRRYANKLSEQSR